MPLIYNPHRRHEKTILDLGLILRDYIREGVPVEKIQLTPGYIILLRLVEEAARQRGITSGFIQFALMESPGYGIRRKDPELVLASMVHRITPTPRD